ncbi:MAG TPA: ECF transporter S component [Candidatus Dormibacteraeota bacterium]
MRLTLASLAGLGLFLWPFTGLGLPAAAPAVAVAIATLLALALVEVGTRRLDARLLALLAALAAVDAALRMLLVNGIGGFTPIFFLVLCAGYVFGPSYGFLTGATALLVSALATGGVGPWLPYEMFGVGWVGAAAGWAGLTSRRTLVLALVGVAAGFGYGALLDAYDWTYFRGAGGFGWVPGMPFGAALSGFAHFYLVTSLAWDAFRAAGNAALVLLLGPAVLTALRRLRARLTLEVVPFSQPLEPER